MKIQIKTSGLLGSYLPPGSKRNSAELDVPEAATPVDVMSQLGLPLEDSYLVSLNGSVVVQSARATTTLKENDKLAIMPPLKGG